MFFHRVKPTAVAFYGQLLLCQETEKESIQGIIMKEKIRKEKFGVELSFKNKCDIF